MGTPQFSPRLAPHHHGIHTTALHSLTGKGCGVSWHHSFLGLGCTYGEDIHSCCMQAWGGQDAPQCFSFSLGECRVCLDSHRSRNPSQMGVPQTSLGAGVLGTSGNELRVERQGWASHPSTAQARLSAPLLYSQISEHSLLCVLNVTPCPCRSICTKGQSTSGCDAADSLPHASPAGEALQGSVITHHCCDFQPGWVSNNVLLYSATV